MPLPNPDIILSCLQTLRKKIISKVEKFNSTDGLHDTVLDPLAILSHFSFLDIKSKDEWYTFEKIRRLDKALMNNIGLFHENVLSSLDGWEKPYGGGFDLKSEKLQIICEIKNKHNTMNSSSTNDTFEKCNRFFSSNRGWTIYLVHIIPKRGKINTEWKVSGREKNDKIRLIDGASFYDLVTSEKDSLRSILLQIPELLLKLDPPVELEKDIINWILAAYDACYS